MEGGAVSQGSRADRPTRPDTLRTSTADAAAAVAPPARKFRKKRPLQNVAQRVTRKCMQEIQEKIGKIKCAISYH